MGSNQRSVELVCGRRTANGEVGDKEGGWFMRWQEKVSGKAVLRSV
jgi:hypothetical protein